MRLFLVKSLGALLLLAYVNAPLLALSQATPSDVERQAAELYQQVMSPFCPGRSLNDCPSSKAGELKAKIRAELEAGAPAEQILDRVFAEFGDQYRAMPRYEGFGRVAWWAPVAFIAAGLALALYVVARRNRAAMSGAPEGKSALSDDVRQRIEDELARLE